MVVQTFYIAPSPIFNSYAVNSSPFRFSATKLGSVAVAGYTAATKVDQLSVLMNNAFGIALSSFVAQNYGAGQYRRISEGVRACLVQIELCNVLMCALLLGCRHLVVPLFLDSPTA